MRVVNRGVVPGGCAAFLADQRSPFKSLVGGTGSAKTHTSVLNALVTGSINAPLPYLYVEPTIDLVRTIALVTFRRVLDDLEVPHQWRDRDKILEVGAGDSRFPVMMRSGEQPERITGFEAAAGCIDEAARQKRDVFKAVVQRCRAPGTRRKQIALTSTPEGLNWFYEVAESKAPRGMALYRARTADNPYVAPSYLANMRATLSAAEYEAYAEGKFVNLAAGLVYSSFARAQHNRVCANPFDGDLVVGCDFNVGKMHWVIGRRIGDEVHVFAEIVGTNTNTYRQRDALVTKLIEMRGKHRLGPWDRERFIRATRVHTDASGSARKTSASESDVAILRRGGLFVVEASSNPPIKDRVYTVELALRMGRLFVDCDACPELARSIEGQGWGRDGMPEKKRGDDDLSGGVDALGYLLWGFVDLQSTHPGSRIGTEQYG